MKNQTPYTSEITRLLGVLGVGSTDPILVEAWMRSEHSTLDGLSQKQFAEEVKLGWACVLQFGKEASTTLAQSFGLIH